MGKYYILIRIIDNWCFATVEDGDIMMWCWCSDVSWFITPRNLSFLQVNNCSELLPYTINAPECYTTTYAAPNYYTDVLKYYTIKSQPIRNLGVYKQRLLYYTNAFKYYITTNAAQYYYTEASKFYTIKE
ncbi:hypothetical protein DAPPUDRAFT_319263 [Daphnia pulex]|uniref:Uncharacterized protein n=1 Tax=Daphnia pulex TaxID=6669 RepID=E9GL69_DAPPU|nr:hypothetical protein DAPPUDRAFT_319263 [Daphnia pulex]|eukprot:EFX79803.1 hypothetical protein DAPPUDRAFT_319263 [Daphnia pulex]